MKRVLVPVLLASLSLVISETSLATEREEDLAARVAALEKKIASLEKALAPLIAKAGAEQRVKMQQQNARRRMRKDTENYSRDELREIETLYQVANKRWRSPEAKQSLQTLVEKYDKANRTGCAVLYLGQMSNGKQRVEYLSKAVEKFSDCYYGNGVQVGAYARLLLGQTYLQEGDRERAASLFAELRKQYPESIDHRGNHLLTQLVAKDIE